MSDMCTCVIERFVEPGLVGKQLSPVRDIPSCSITALLWAILL